MIGMVEPYTLKVPFFLKNQQAYRVSYDFEARTVRLAPLGMAGSFISPNGVATVWGFVRTPDMDADGNYSQDRYVLRMSAADGSGLFEKTGTLTPGMDMREYFAQHAMLDSSPWLLHFDETARKISLTPETVRGTFVSLVSGKTLYWTLDRDVPGAGGGRIWRFHMEDEDGGNVYDQTGVYLEIDDTTMTTTLRFPAAFEDLFVLDGSVEYSAA